jgi:homoserine dehydrogenase
MPRPVGVGLLGCGTVGAGVAHILLHGSQALADKTGIDIRLVRIAEPHPERAFVIKATGEKLSVPPGIVTADADQVVGAKDVDIVVEVIGGIEPAKTLIMKALAAGKAVVTANKKLLAAHGREIFRAARESGASVNFEASVCGGIPIIAAMRDGLIANRIDSFVGIVNGTTNYILTEMSAAGRPYEQVLADAQKMGYAETPPTEDVAGLDAANKLVILADLAYHQVFDLADVYVEGIERVRIEDIRHAKDLGYAVKLLAVSRRRPAADSKGADEVELRVHPALVPSASPLASVNGVFNAVVVRGDAVGETMFYGHGAGQMPTASAVVADIVDAARGTAKITFAGLQFYREGRPKMKVAAMGDIRTQYYARFMAKDERGVLGKLATIMSEHRISIARVEQKRPLESAAPSGTMAVVVITHSARESDFQAAEKKIDVSGLVTAPATYIRVEEDEG